MTRSRPVISDLCARPDFLPVVAERIWRAWWRDEGFTLPEMEALVAEGLGPASVPSTFVAHRGDVFLGTASLVADDLAARPAYSPWIVAVYVEPEARGAGIASALVRHVAQMAFRQPIERLYLNAKPAVAPVYEKLGWERIETDVGGVDIFAMDRPR